MASGGELDPMDGHTISRRRVVLGGATIAGAAWVAPSIIAVDRAAAGSAPAGTCGGACAGSANGLSATVLGIAVGPLPATPGTSNATGCTPVNLNLNGVVVVGTACGVVNGCDAVGSVNLTAADIGLPISATVLQGEASVGTDCCSLDLSSTIAQLVIAGTTITVPPGGFAPNTDVGAFAGLSAVLAPLGVTIIANQQTKSCSAGTTTGSVTALHITVAPPNLPTIADVSLGNASISSPAGKCVC